MAFYLFHWTSRTIDKLESRDLTAEEYEEVVCDPSYEYTSRTSGFRIAEGWTFSGRYLLCVDDLLGPDDVLPITAFDVEPH